MKLNTIASAISRSIWLIDPRLAQGYLPAIARFLNGEPVSFFDDDDEEEPELQCYLLTPTGDKIAVERGGTGNLFGAAPEGSIAIIPITGVIMKEDNCGAPGTDTMATWLKDAYAAENVIGAILRINSGGGSVFGTGEFGEVISSANKPVLAYNEGLMASAAYWLGSSAKEIWSSHATTEIGSIGTAINFYDNREALAKYGYKSVYINADSSPDKNQDYFKAIDGNTDSIKVQILNPTNDIFMRTVKANRGDKLKLHTVKIGETEYDEPLTGKVYMAEEARDKYGLIDQIGSFEQAVERVYQLSEDPSSSHTTQKSNNMFGRKFTGLSALAGVAAASITAAQVAAVNEQISAENINGVTLALDTDLATASTAVDANSQALTQINAALGAGNEKTTLAEATTALIAALTASKKDASDNATSANDWKAKAVEFGAKDAEVPTETKKEGDDKIEKTGGTNKFHSQSDEDLKALREQAGLTRKAK